MKWIKISLKTTTEAVDFISAMFDEIGLEGIEIEDKIPLSEEDRQKLFIDILPELEPDDGIAIVSSYVSTEQTSEQTFEQNPLQKSVSVEAIIEEWRKKIEEGLEEIKLFADLGACELVFEEKDDRDWIDNWKEYFKPFYAAEHILIKPSWELLPENKKEEDLVIEIDPGTAFGTGSHETTKLCIQSLQKKLKQKDAVLDVGCGSGILSLISLKLGADRVVGTDIDENALKITWENMERNGITKEKFTSYEGSLIDNKQLQEAVGGGFDLIVANILADVIILLSGEIARHMKPTGIFISSGIIDKKKEEVQNALKANGFEILEVNEMGEWVSFTACIAGI